MAACERPDPDAELDAAAASLMSGNLEDASLRLNYVVQLDPENVRARELRGDIALLQGDYISAASEYVRVRELGVPRDVTAIRLAESYVALGQIDKALVALDESESMLAGEPLYWIVRAEVLLAAGRLSETERSLNEAQRLGDGSARGLTTSAQLAYARGEQARASNVISEALAVAPDDPRVRIANAELLARNDRLTEAAAELERAADLYRQALLGPRETFSLLGLVQIHIARNDLGAAEAVAARLAKQAPDVLLTSYYRGLVMFRHGHFDEAASLVQPLVNASPETIQFRSLLGAIQLARGNMGQAEQQFLRVLAVAPRDPAATKLLAKTRLGQQRPRAALEALQAVQDTAVEDPQISFLSGIANVLSGDAQQGLLYLEQAAALDPTNELLKLQLARAYISAGRDADASKLLTGSFGEDARAIEANLVQLFAESRRGNAESAADIAEALLAGRADDPRVLTAVAVHYQLNGDIARARELFERAAEFDSQDATARLFIAASLAQEGRQDEAELLLRNTIQEQPQNTQALAGLAQLLARRGAFDEAAVLFEKSAEHSTSVVPRLALAQMLLRQEKVAEAKKQLDLVAGTAPKKPEVLALRGVIALAEGRPDDALAPLEQAAHLLPDNLGVSLAFARARLANGQATAARETLLQVLELAPESLPIQLALGDAELQSGNIEGALSLAADLKASFPAQGGGYVLEGKAFIASRQYSAASKSLSSAFERQPTWPVLALKIQALRLADRIEEAWRANDAWLTDHPNHVRAGLMRAVMMQSAGQIQESLQAYKSVLITEPDNLVALNNAAWLLHELGDPVALSFAERAHDAQPDNAAVLDTFGWILLAEGQHELAIEKLAKAAELTPAASEIRYHLAEALFAGGESVRAREVLEMLLAEVRDFDKRADAVRLLESI